MAQRNRSQRLSGQYPLSYVGVNPVSPSNFIIDNRPPGPTDAQNFLIGDIWLDNSNYPAPPTALDIWMLVSLTSGIATWIRFGGGGTVVTLEGNVGGPVPPDVLGNIHTIGDGVGITVVGTPGTNTLTWSLVGGGVATQSYLTDDAQVEVPNAAGQLSVFGGASAPDNAFININTRRGADVNTVAVCLNNSIVQPFTNAAGTDGVYSLGVTNVVVDRFMHGYGNGNTFLGRQAGNLTLTVANASNNTAIGNLAGNSLVGTGALQGALNTFIGTTSGRNITQGSANFFGGAGSGLIATTSSQCVALGADSASNLLTGSNNTFAGFSSGNAYTGAESGNTNIGADTTGLIGEMGVTRIGAHFPAGANVFNTFIGTNAGNSTYTLALATQNTATGYDSLFGLTLGTGNSTFGANSAQVLTTGSRNSFFGLLSGNALVSGDNNIFIGQSSGGSLTTNESNNILIGATGTIGDNFTLRIGNSIFPLQRSFILGIRGVVTGVNDAIPVLIDSANQLGTVSSSERYKDNIEDMDDYSCDILDLRCVTFNFKKHSADIVSVGLIAEEVEDVMPQLVIKNEEGLPETVRYLDLIPMLLNEVQKLEKRVKELESICQKQV